MFGFVDAGNVFGENEKVTLRATLRASVGVGLSAGFRRSGRCAWPSAIPVPQVRLAIESRQLQFQIGTSF